MLEWLRRVLNKTAKKEKKKRQRDFPRREQRKKEMNERTEMTRKATGASDDQLASNRCFPPFAPVFLLNILPTLVFFRPSADLVEIARMFNGVNSLENFVADTPTLACAL